MNEYYRRRDYDTGSKVRTNWFGIRPFWYAMALSLLIWALIHDGVRALMS